MLLRVVVSSSGRPTLQLWLLLGNYPGTIWTNLGWHYVIMTARLITRLFMATSSHLAPIVCVVLRESPESGDAPLGDNNVASTCPMMASHSWSPIWDVFCNWDILPRCDVCHRDDGPGSLCPGSGLTTPCHWPDSLMCHPQLDCHTHIPWNISYQTPMLLKLREVRRINGSFSVRAEETVGAG